MALPSGERREGGERRVRVDGNRVECWRLGWIDLERCEECLYLQRFEVDEATSSVRVVCAASDLDGDSEFAW
jgi:hypothetical protein